MSSLADLKAKYKLGNGARYEPKPDCLYCKGTGERTAKDRETRFCLCLFISHDMSDMTAQMLATVAGAIRRKLEKGGA